MLAQFLIINKCSLHEVLFERKAEITLIIPDLDNASEGRENTRLRVTPELFYNRTYKTEYDEILVTFCAQIPSNTQTKKTASWVILSFQYRDCRTYNPYIVFTPNKTLLSINY